VSEITNTHATHTHMIKQHSHCVTYHFTRLIEPQS